MTPEQKAQVVSFIEQLYRLGGFQSWAEFGREAGGLSPEQMSDWSRGVNVPTGYNLLRLIWAAERRHDASPVVAAMMTDPVVGAGIRIAQEIAVTGMPAPSPGEATEDPGWGGSLPGDRLAALEAKVAEMVRLTREALELLRESARQSDAVDRARGLEDAAR